MTTGGPASESTGQHAADPGPGELQQEIEQAREQLGDTVEQLAAKADVRARARDKVAELAGRGKGAKARPTRPGRRRSLALGA